METLDTFISVIEMCMDHLVRLWSAAGSYFTFEGIEGEVTINHLTWACNILLVAEGVSVIQLMAQQLAEELRGIGLPWRPSSVELMQGGSLQHMESSIAV